MRPRLVNLRVLFWRLRSYLRGRTLDRRLDDEIRHHLELAAADKLARGMTTDEAQSAALRDFGRVIRIKEAHREARGLPRLDALAQDLRYACRVLAKNPGFTVVAVFSLSLGIGANAAIFGLVDAVMLRALPVEAPQQLVIFASHDPRTPSPGYGFTFEMLQAVRRDNHSLAGVFAATSLRINAEADGIVEPTVQGQLVSGSYHATLGVTAALGRTLTPEDDARPGEHAVAVLSHGYWTIRFGQDPDVLGRTLRLNGYPFTIIGVTTPGFFGTHVGAPVDITVPLAMQVQVMPEVGTSWIREGTYQPWLTLMGRLKPGVGTEQAQAELDAIYQRHLEDWRAFEGDKKSALGHPRLQLEPGSRGLSELRMRYSLPLTVLMAVVALVLLAACANAANLLLARSMARRREIALRISLGAGRSRLVRQLLTESLLLAMIGGAVGLLLSLVAGGPLTAWLVGEQMQQVLAGPDLRLLGFTIGASLLTGLLFGVIPAFTTSQVDPQVALKDGLRTESGHRFRARGLLVGAQVAVSLMLLVCAGLFVRTLMNLRTLELGIEQERVLVLRLEPHGSNQKRNPDGSIKADLLRTYGTLISRVESLPGVRAATLAGMTPLGNENQMSIVFRAPGYLAKPGEDLRLRMIQIYPNYFSTLGIRVVAGRDFTAGDNAETAARRELARAQMADGSSPRAIVINQTMARRFFGGDVHAIGRRFSQGEVVGVVEDVRDRGPREPVVPLVYATYAQAPTGRGQMTLLVRTAGDPHAIANTVRQLARSIDPNMPLLDVQTVEERVNASISQERLLALLSSLFGAVALLLACVGLYGVMAYAVTRRHAEFGLRLALGATRAGLLRLVFKESFALVAGGVGIGVLATLLASRFIANRLFGVSAADPATIAIATVLLMAVAAVAVLVPARRAAKSDPLVALRSQ